MPKKMPEKEHFGTLEISKLFLENQLQMEHSKLLMFPENLCGSLRDECQAACKIVTDNSARTGASLNLFLTLATSKIIPVSLGI